MEQIHPIAQQLSKLQISAKESVADSGIQNTDQLKEYLHITREPETILKQIILDAAQDDKASLILVCGNVGDGKSHTLAQIQKDPEVKSVISGFNVHNDATESDSPKKTCIETLDVLLDCFSDEKLGTTTTKQIVAINLGTLSNFIAETGDKYSKLANYILENKIVEEDLTYSVDSVTHPHFKHVNFTDYHLYNLTSQGAKLGILDTLLERIVENKSTNSIYQGYVEIKDENWAKDCLIRLNYEFLFNIDNRKRISDLILRLVVKDKVIISVRQLLNFIHDLIVPANLSKLPIPEYISTISKYSISQKLHNYLPFYIFDNPNLSFIFNGLKTLDPCYFRSESLDQVILDLNTGKTALLNKIIELNFDENISCWIQDDKIKRDFIIAFVIRLEYFTKMHNHQEDNFVRFCKALYFDNTNQSLGLIEIHDDIKKAVKNWYGNTYVTDKVMLLVESTQNKFRLFKTQKTKLIPGKKSKDAPEELLKFTSSLRLNFEGVNNGKSHKIEIDYGLFELLERINRGYRPNKIDRNNYMYFSNFVDKLFYEDASTATIYVDEINVDHDIDYILSKDEYGRFTFENMSL